jgi:UPF0042 nucleotide-binding protein
MKIVILTGYSGSGKSSALNSVEERGYYCVDNLPAQMLGDFIDIVRKSGLEKVAVVIDARGREFMAGMEKRFEDIKKKHSLRVVFFDSDLAAITKRYKEHRLKHPLALKGTVREGYEIEKKLLSVLRHEADLVLDTSKLNVHSLKSLIQKSVLGELSKNFETHLVSFGFKNGVPQEADFVFDVRLLINPYFVPSLKRKTGKSPEVARYIFKSPETAAFLRKTAAFIKDMLREYEKKGRPFLTVAFGCTGGKHRSVFVTEWMRKALQGTAKKVRVHHRDIAVE